jgi:hypothetical protein
MSTRRIVDVAYEQQGVPGLLLECERMRLTLFPDAGAKILNLVHLPSGHDLLWTNPRVPLRRTYPGAAFDDVWCGGWDELFPTDPPGEVEGNTFHDHGDLWCGPWDWSVEHDDGDEATVVLRRYAVALPCLMEKWVTVRRSGLEVHFRHRLTNLGARPVPFTWNLHVAHAIAPDSRIHLPARTMEAVPGRAGRFAGRQGPLDWPVHEGTDMGAVAGVDSGLTEWLYARELDEGWCAVTHPTAGVGLGLAFDPGVFGTVWLWGVYGGWRGHYVLLTEPSTSPPGGIERAVADGTAASLAAGATLETATVATILEDVVAAGPADVPPAGLQRAS